MSATPKRSAESQHPDDQGCQQDHRGDPPENAPHHEPSFSQSSCEPGCFESLCVAVRWPRSGIFFARSFVFMAMATACFWGLPAAISVLMFLPTAAFEPDLMRGIAGSRMQKTQRVRLGFQVDSDFSGRGQANCALA